MATGEVIAFDDAKGWGTVRSTEGDEHFFHCTAIVDGSRTIEVGVPVDFAVEPGGRGRWEATRVEPRATT